MTLFMVRLDPDTQAAARWFAGESLLSRQPEDGAYRWHALLAATFGRALAPKPFRVLSRRNRPLQILAYTKEGPEVLDAAARDFADPLALAALGLDRNAVVGKLIPPFSAGRRLGFSMVVRPTIRTDLDGDRTKSAELDAYVMALRRAEVDGAGQPDRASVYCDWAKAKLEAGGARVVDLRLDGLDQVATLRRGVERRLRAVQGHSVQIAGALDVTDAASFAALVARGVGRHRAFGYGMLLLSPG